MVLQRHQLQTIRTLALLDTANKVCYPKLFALYDFHCYIPGTPLLMKPLYEAHSFYVYLKKSGSAPELSLNNFRSRAELNWGEKHKKSFPIQVFSLYF